MPRLGIDLVTLILAFETFMMMAALFAFQLAGKRRRGEGGCVVGGAGGVCPFLLIRCQWLMDLMDNHLMD